MTDTEDPAATRWHLDRRFPVALLVGLLLQLVAAAIIAGQFSEQIKSNTREIVKNAKAIDDMRAVQSDLPARLASIETTLLNISDLLREQKREVDTHERRYHYGNPPNGPAR